MNMYKLRPRIKRTKASGTFIPHIPPMSIRKGTKSYTGVLGLYTKRLKQRLTTQQTMGHFQFFTYVTPAHIGSNTSLMRMGRLKTVSNRICYRKVRGWKNIY